MSGEQVPAAVRIVHDVVAVCKSCGAEIYREQHLNHPVHGHQRLPSGNFSQQTDHNGVPTGAIRPFCPHCATTQGS